MYKNGFGINNLQWLMCHKTQPNQTETKKNILLFVELLAVRWVPGKLKHPVFLF